MGSRTNFFCIVFFTCLAKTISADGDSVVTTNPGYPKPYKGSLPKVEARIVVALQKCSIFRYRYTHSAGPGQGVAVFFYQFLANAGDCVTVCDVEAVCLSLCGDAMDHVNMKKALVVNSTATITMQSISSPDSYYHSGIYMRSSLFDLSDRSYFKCNSTVQLEDGVPFFLVSQNYPFTPFDYSECSVKFNSRDAIRVAIYDLVTKNPITFKGTNLAGDPVQIALSGREVTDDEPLPLYFLGSLEVSFAFRNTSTYYSRGFYILVDSYTREASSSQSCLNAGDVLLKSGESVAIGTKNFGMDAYATNMNCSYSFHNSEEEHLLALAMEYETEKCCDIMFITGLAPPPYDLYNYQGFMQPLFQFANNSLITLKFSSDGVVGAAGFKGTVYNIDCTCGSGTLELTEQIPVLNVTSPGFESGAPTYCPNLDCSWTVMFSKDFEVVFNLANLNLRSTGTQTDMLTVQDNFGRILLQSSSIQYGDRSKGVITSGQFAISFNTSSASAFPVENAAPGFRVELTLVKKVMRRKTIVLSDEQFMMDISTQSFAEGLNLTYEYSITARPNKQVTIYFFTMLSGIVSLDIYDGPDTNAAEIDTRTLYASFPQYGVPLKITSSGETIVIRIRPNLYNTQTKLDFQALVTDWTPDPSCPPLVTTSAIVQQPLTLQLTGAQCISVYHSTNDYDLSAGISVATTNTSAFELYKGLTTNASHLIKGESSTVWPKFIYGPYVVLLYKSSQENTVTYSWNRGKFTTTLTMSPNETGVIMSQDYLPEYQTPAFEQQFSIELISDSAHMTGIRLEFLKSTGQGHGMLQMQKYNQILQEIQYPASDGSTTFEQCGTKMLISYISPGGYSNGLYARYSRGSQVCNHVASARVHLLIGIFILLFTVYNLN